MARCNNRLLWGAGEQYALRGSTPAQKTTEPHANRSRRDGPSITRFHHPRFLWSAVYRPFSSAIQHFGGRQSAARYSQRDIGLPSRRPYPAIHALRCSRPEIVKTLLPFQGITRRNLQLFEMVVRIARSANAPTRSIDDRG